jgi:hypothetical protein
MNLLNSRQDGAANTLELLERLVEAHDLVVARPVEGGQVGVVPELRRSSLPVREKKGTRTVLKILGMYFISI